MTNMNSFIDNVTLNNNMITITFKDNGKSVIEYIQNITNDMLNIVDSGLIYKDLSDIVKLNIVRTMLNIIVISIVNNRLKDKLDINKNYIISTVVDYIKYDYNYVYSDIKDIEGKTITDGIVSGLLSIQIL